MIYLVGGADVDLKWLRSLDSPKVQWVGVDRGAISILKAGLIPDYAFGDFDSVTQDERQEIKRIVKHNVEEAASEKDETDMELALNWALTQKDEIKLCAVTGQRLDHFFGNVQLLLSERVLHSGVVVEIIDKQNRLRCMLPGSELIPTDDQFPYFSIIPMTPKVEGLSIDGVKYPLVKADVYIGNTLTISNEITVEKASISFETGIIMIIRSKD
ncbi:thiamine diphosphokinase [Jeotgalibacillus soli]|uniref:Thiamine diphosphokinase n=1 Tax=Jeotgalibacillus soli TaxID=889306 RepID=A0A0C2VLG4_9BACL|nr:thiamine diphosphokinase [Jeotgalibacillus soli]KIL44843.1 hypothetical protein KP78_23870 [Jeotgalibacillus soli]